MLRLRRKPGTSLLLIIHPSSVDREVTINFDGHDKIGIQADRTIDIIRDDAVNRKEPQDAPDDSDPNENSVRGSGD